jgi:hypothetical protein
MGLQWVIYIARVQYGPLKANLFKQTKYIELEAMLEEEFTSSLFLKLDIGQHDLSSLCHFVIQLEDLSNH